MPRPQFFAIALLATFIAGLPPTTAVARDRSFTAVLKGLERDYDVKRKRLPGIGLAKLFVNVTHPAGVSKFDFALFEGANLRQLAATPDFDTRLHAMLGVGWKPFVQVDSPKQRKRVLLFARPSGRRMELFLFSLETADAVALFVRVNPASLQRMLDHSSESFLADSSWAPVRR